MAFSKSKQRTPTAIRDLRIILSDEIATESAPARQTIRYHLQLLDQDGNEMTAPFTTGDLEIHLTAQQTAQLKALLNNIRAKAVAEIL